MKLEKDDAFMRDMDVAIQAEEDKVRSGVHNANTNSLYVETL